MSVPSFIFGGDTGLSYEQLQKRRAVLEAMQARSNGAPRNVGEGLSALGDALSYRVEASRLGSAEADMQKEQAGLDGILGSAQASMLSPSGPGAGYSSATGPIADASTPAAAPFASDDIKGGIVATANALGIDPIDLGTAISYETGGTFDPTKAGPTTQWGQHKGLIQFGEPQAKQYGVDWSNPVGSQLGPDGAVAKYLRDTGVKPGMGMMDIYSAINAGGVGRYNRSDANNGGAPGTVADKVNNQMAGHRAKALALLGSNVAGGGAAAAIDQAAPVQVASADPGFMPAAPADLRNAIAGNVAAGTLRGETLAAPSSTMDPRDIAARQAAEEAEKASNPNIRAYSGPGMTADGGPSAAPQNAALVAALQARQAQAAPALSAPQVVAANPVPPQAPMAGLDPRTSPEAQALMASGQFDGVSYSGSQGAQAPAAGLQASSAPAAPSGVQQVSGAVQQAAQARGVDPSVLIGIANNPRATDGQRRVAQAILQQQMEQQQTAQTRSYNERIKREEWQRQDNRFAVTDAREAETRKAWQKLDDNTLFNPVTGETKSIAPEGGAPTFSGPSVEAQALNGLISSGAITKDQALQLGAGKTVSGPNGEILFMTPQGVFGQNAGGGSPQPVAPAQAGAQAAPAPASPGMIPLTEPKVTIDEKKAQTFADRMTTSGKIIDDMGTAGSGFLDKAASWAMPMGTDSLVTSDEFKKVDQARRDFINAQLRRESGAVIGADEFDSANKQYFPQPGDTQDVLEQKRRNREIVIKGMQRDGGPTYQPPATTLTPQIEDLVKKYGG